MRNPKPDPKSDQAGDKPNPMKIKSNPNQAKSKSNPTKIQAKSIRIQIKSKPESKPNQAEAKIQPKSRRNPSRNQAGKLKKPATAESRAQPRKASRSVSHAECSSCSPRRPSAGPWCPLHRALSGTPRGKDEAMKPCLGI